MNLHSLFGATSAALLAILVLQQLRFKRAFPGYQSLRAAIADALKKAAVANEQKTQLEQEVGRNRDIFESLQREIVSKSANLESLEKRRIQINDSIEELERSAAVARTNCASATEQHRIILNDIRTTNGDLASIRKIVDDKKSELQKLEARNAHVLSLETKVEQFSQELYSLEAVISNAKSEQSRQLESIQTRIAVMQTKQKQAEITLSTVMGKVDLYSRIDEYTQKGHFETPAYLYDTSMRYQAEIKQLREQQKNLIREKVAVVYPQEVFLCSDSSMNKRVLDGQATLMLLAFNIECDLLIEKVNPGNLDRTLEQIEKKAEQLERSAATMRCGFGIQYVQLKFEECKLLYEYKLKKQEEQQEQRLIREQMKEEVRVQKQYEEAMREAEKDELKYRRMIEKAREQLGRETEQERALTLAKISLLEEDLKEALEKGQRAKSMAEQTRRGFVYVISNIGSFGQGVYKIGLTRRLDPQERVDELGDASVPFPFDVHAMCFSEDAPARERALHKQFGSRRFNAVNLRKEFFKVDLEEIQVAVEGMLGSEIDFKITAHAKDYFESKRLMPA